MPPIVTLPQRQGIRSRQIWYPETSLGTDPGSPIGYLMHLADEAGFGSTQANIDVPVFKGLRKPGGIIPGNITAEGENSYLLEGRIFPRLLKSVFGTLGYVRPAAGTTSLHRFFIPTNPDAEMGSGQFQDESLETPKQIIRNKGVRPGVINIAYAAEGAARFGCGFMGIGDEVYTDLSGTVTDYGVSAFSYFNGYAKLNNSFLAGMTDFTASIDPGLSRQEAAFHEGRAASINYGAINMTGSLGLMFSTAGAAPENNMNFYNMAVNQQNVPLDVAWMNAPAATVSQWVRLILPAIRFSRRGFRPGGAAGKIITQDWRIHDTADADIPAEIFNKIIGPYNIGATTNILSIKVNGAAGVPVTITTGTAITPEAIAILVNANGTLSPLITAEAFMGRVMLRTKLAGSVKSLAIDIGAVNSAHTVMGFDAIVMTGFDDTPVLWEVYNDIAVDL